MNFPNPDYKADEKAFYHARVMKIPIPSWTACDAKRFGLKVDPEVPMTITERTYTSPTWYTP